MTDKGFSFIERLALRFDLNRNRKLARNFVFEHAGEVMEIGYYIKSAGVEANTTEYPDASIFDLDKRCIVAYIAPDDDSENTVPKEALLQIKDGITGKTYKGYPVYVKSHK